MSAEFWMGAFIGAVLVLLLLLLIVGSGGKKNAAKAKDDNNRAADLLEQRNRLTNVTNDALREMALSLGKGSPKMYLRDWMAGMALQGITDYVARGWVGPEAREHAGRIAEHAFNIADAMMEARGGKEAP